MCWSKETWGRMDRSLFPRNLQQSDLLNGPRQKPQSQITLATYWTGSVGIRSHENFWWTAMGFGILDAPIIPNRSLSHQLPRLTAARGGSMSSIRSFSKGRRKEGLQKWCAKKQWRRFKRKDENIISGQIIIFHQPRFPWNKGISLTKPPFEVRSCEVAIIWPENMLLS